MAWSFWNIFKNKQEPKAVERIDVLSGGGSFSAWSGDAYSNDIYRSAVDSIARNVAKLKGSHTINYKTDNRSEGDSRINRLLQIEPNPYMNAFDMLYKLATHYFLYNNAFAYIQTDDKGQISGIYPLNATRAEFMSDDAGRLYCHFMFGGGKSTILPYSDIVHLRRNFNSNDLLGDDNTALSPALQLAHTQNEGIISGIKNSASIRGLLKRSQIADATFLKQIKDNFVQDYLDISNNGGVAVLDSSTEYIPLENKGYITNEKQMQAVRLKIYNYLGVSENIVNSTYSEDEWAAFYESTIEPLALQLSLEFTRKIFNDRERAFGNSVLFESGRLQFSSNSTKVAIIRDLVPYGLLTINQALEILNLPSVAGGEKRLQTLNVITEEQALKYQMAKAGWKNTAISLDNISNPLAGDDTGGNKNEGN